MIIFVNFNININIILKTIEHNILWRENLQQFLHLMSLVLAK